jgi:hypothetical protein
MYSRCLVVEGGAERVVCADDTVQGGGGSWARDRGLVRSRLLRSIETNSVLDGTKRLSLREYGEGEPKREREREGGGIHPVFIKFEYEWCKEEKLESVRTIDCESMTYWRRYRRSRTSNKQQQRSRTGEDEPKVTKKVEQQKSEG